MPVEKDPEGFQLFTDLQEVIAEFDGTAQSVINALTFTVARAIVTMAEEEEVEALAEHISERILDNVKTRLAFNKMMKQGD